MQKLKERYTYTPKNITHVLGNCDHVLNIPEGRESVHDLKTSFNNPDASLTPREQGGKNLRVSSGYVLGMRGKPLMPYHLDMKGSQLFPSLKERVSLRKRG